MFAESEAVGARLRNPSGGKPRKAVAARRKEKQMAAAKKGRTRKSPAKKTTARKAPAKKKRTRRVTKGPARRTSRVMVRGKSVSRAVSNKVRAAKRKSVTYRQYKRGGAAIILRASNPTDQPKAVASFVVGAVAGVGVSVLLDRWLATRASSQTNDKVQYGPGASQSIHAKADGVRVFSQIAVGGLAATGAYMARKKMPMLAVGLAGFAGAFLIKAGFMVFSDHLLPMLFKSKKAGDAGDRYFPDRQPPAGSGGVERPMRRMVGGSSHPFFGGKPARIGPVATGNVGGCPSCGSAGRGNHCGCGSFSSPEQDCLRRVSENEGTGGPRFDIGGGDFEIPGGGGKRVPDMPNGGGDRDGTPVPPGGNGDGTPMTPSGDGYSQFEVGGGDMSRTPPRIPGMPIGRERPGSSGTMLPVQPGKKVQKKRPGSPFYVAPYVK